MLVGSGAAKAKKLFDAAQLAAFTQYAIAKEYKTFVIKRRDTKYLNSCLQAAKPMLQCKPTELDNNEFLLNTTRHILSARWIMWHTPANSNG